MSHGCTLDKRSRGGRVFVSYCSDRKGEVQIAMLIWRRKREAYFRNGIGWGELVYGRRRRVRKVEEEENEI